MGTNDSRQQFKFKCRFRNGFIIRLNNSRSLSFVERMELTNENYSFSTASISRPFVWSPVTQSRVASPPSEKIRDELSTMLVWTLCVSRPSFRIFCVQTHPSESQLVSGRDISVSLDTLPPKTRGTLRERRCETFCCTSIPPRRTFSSSQMRSAFS